MKTISSWCIWAVLIWSANAASAVRADDEPPVVTLQAKHNAYAVNPETGDMAAIDSERNSLHLYKAAYFGLGTSAPDASAVAKPAKVGSTPSALVYKKYKARGVWAVVCSKDAHMYLHDGGTLDVIKKIPLTNGDVRHVYASINPADPYIYYVHSGGRDNAVNSRVNLARLVDEGPVFDESNDTAISATGNLFYLRNTSSSSSGRGCWRKVEGAGPNGKPRFDQLSNEHNSTAGYLPDPFEEYTIAGQNGQDVYTADLTRKAGQLNFRPACIFAGRPIIAGINSNDVVVASYNNFQTSGRFSLSPALTKAQPAGVNAQQPNRGAQARRRGGGSGSGTALPVELFADDKNERLIAVCEDRAVALPLPAFKLPDEPYLVVRADIPGALTIGQPARIALRKVDERTKIAISDGPEGVTIEDESLVWTPTEEQIGSHRITLELAHNEFDRRQPMELKVARPAAVLPFNIRGFSVSADAKRALCWSAESERSPSIDGPTQIAVVDLEKLNVAVQATVPYRVATGAIDGSFVYLSQTNTGAIQALSVADLARKKQVVHEEPIRWLHIVAGTLFAVTISGDYLAYQLPDLKRDAGKNVLRSGDSRRDIARLAGLESGLGGIARTRDGWMLDGVAYSADLKEVRLIGKLDGVILVGQATARNRGYFPSDRRTVPSLWGDLRPELFANQQSIDRREQVIDNLLMETYPTHLTLTVATQFEGGGNRQHETLRLEARELIAGQVKSQIVLDKRDQALQQRDHFGYSMIRETLHAAGDLVFAAYERKLFKYQFPKPEPESFPTPLHFVPKQSALVIKPDPKTRLTHQIEGGEKPYQVTLVNAGDAMVVDPETADIQVDGRALVQQGLQKLVGADVDPARDQFTKSFDDDDAGERNQDSIKNAVLVFKSLVGREPQGIPVAVPVHLRLSDASGQTAELNYFVFAEVPQAEYTAQLNQRTKQVAAQRKNQEEEQRKREAQFARERDAITALAKAQGKDSIVVVGGEIAARVQRLEERMQSIEDRLELITRLLTDRRAGPRGLPADPRNPKTRDSQSQDNIKQPQDDTKSEPADPFSTDEKTK